MTRALPVAPEYVALMSASPADTAVTKPAGDTLATPPFDDCQLAWDVTDCVVELERVAVAENCAVWPTVAGDVGPVTVTPVTVGAAGVDGVVGVEPPPPPQLGSASANAKALTNRQTFPVISPRCRLN